MVGGTELPLAWWRREVGELYARVRGEADPVRGHLLWREGRDKLFRTHPCSPLTDRDALRRGGLSYWPYDPALRFALPMVPAGEPAAMTLGGGDDGAVQLRLIGQVHLPPPLGVSLSVWWLQQYAGGLFLPLRDGTAGSDSYGGGRYLFDTAKGADLGGDGSMLNVDLNFLYHPSCCYNDAWTCPLAPEGNITSVPVRAGERL